MSHSWYLYTTLAPPEAVAVSREYDAAMERLQARYDLDGLAEADAGGPRAPTPADVISRLAERGETADAAVLERLPQCRATISFDYVREDPEGSPLQVTALRFFLERLAPCVMDFGDVPFDLGETVLARLAPLESRGELGKTAAPKPKKAAKPAAAPTARVARPGDLRALRILGKLEDAQQDRDAAMDVSRAVSKLSANAQRYLKLLIEEGVRGDEAATAALGITVDALHTAVDEIDAALGE